MVWFVEPLFDRPGEHRAYFTRLATETIKRNLKYTQYSAAAFIFHRSIYAALDFQVRNDYSQSLQPLVDLTVCAEGDIQAPASSVAQSLNLH